MSLDGRLKSHKHVSTQGRKIVSKDECTDPDDCETITIEDTYVPPDPLPTSRGVLHAIDYGVAVRIILDIRLRQVDVETALSFGMADLATAVAADQAEVNVEYDTIGVMKDILPENLPQTIESLNDIIAIQSAFQTAVFKISTRWNAAIERFQARQGSTYINSLAGRVDDYRTDCRTVPTPRPPSAAPTPAETETKPGKKPGKKPDDKPDDTKPDDKPKKKSKTQSLLGVELLCDFRVAPIAYHYTRAETAVDEANRAECLLRADLLPRRKRKRAREICDAQRSRMHWLPENDSGWSSATLEPKPKTATPVPAEPKPAEPEPKASPANP